MGDMASQRAMQRWVSFGGHARGCGCCNSYFCWVQVLAQVGAVENQIFPGELVDYIITLYVSADIKPKDELLADYQNNSQHDAPEEAAETRLVESEYYVGDCWGVGLGLGLGLGLGG